MRQSHTQISSAIYNKKLAPILTIPENQCKNARLKSVENIAEGYTPTNLQAYAEEVGTSSGTPQGLMQEPFLQSQTTLLMLEGAILEFSNLFVSVGVPHQWPCSSLLLDWSS